MRECFKIIKNRTICGYDDDSNELFSDEIESNFYEDEYFYSLSIHSIISIIEKKQLCENKNFSTFCKILLKSSEYRSSYAPLILNVCDFPDANLDECAELISKVTCSPICCRLKELYKPNNKPLDFVDNIFTAVKEGKIDSVKYIVSHDPLVITQTDKDKRTPLHYSYIYEQNEIKDILIEKGSDKDSLDIYMFKPSDYPINKPNQFESDIIEAVKTMIYRA